MQDLNRDINSDEYFKEIVRINNEKKEKLKKELPDIYELVYGNEDLLVIY